MSDEPTDPRVAYAAKQLSDATTELAATLIARLGESPEAVRGAVETLTMLAKLIGGGFVDNEDVDLVMDVAVSALESCLRALHPLLHQPRQGEQQ